MTRWRARIGAARLAAIAGAVGLAVPGSAAQAETATGTVGPASAGAMQGQVILNPEPDFDAPSPVRRAQEALGTLEPGAAGPDPSGSAAKMGTGTDCALPDGWSVVVVRGGRAPETVRGHMISVMPPGC